MNLRTGKLWGGELGHGIVSISERQRIGGHRDTKRTRMSVWGAGTCIPEGTRARTVEAGELWLGQLGE